MSERLALFTGGAFGIEAKTAYGILRFAPREVVCVVDSEAAGHRTDEVESYARRSVPIVATVAEAAALGANRLVIGVAPFGGRLTDAWRDALVEGIRLGMDVEAGLHSELHDDPILRAAAHEHGRQLVDLRAAPADLRLPTLAARPPDVRVIHSVGSNCAIGKMTVTLELDQAARDRGLASVFAATGQTGIAISGWGICVDHVISDFIAGAAEMIVDEGIARGGKIVFVEGQGALIHPAYSGVTLGLLHGARPDALVLCHRVGQDENDDYPQIPIPPLADLVALYEQTARVTSPGARVGAIVLNTRDVNGDGDARELVARAAADTGLPAADIVRFGGADAILDAVL